jgi:anti-sigma B factor antagonist
VVSIHERRIGDITVLQPDGRLVLSENPGDAVIKDRVDALLQEGCNFFVLDLAQVSHVDTSGLTTLVGAYIAVRKRGGRIALLSPTPRVRELLGVTRLNSFLDIFDSEDAATGSFAAAPRSAPPSTPPSRL